MSTSDAIEYALAEMIKASASPEVQEAQVLLLRRLALEGSVFPTRIPAPRNITELGGYLNLLEKAGEPKLRTSAIASALGLASPSSLEWDDSTPRLGFSSVSNNLAAATNGGLPLSVPMRADFAAAWKERILPRLKELGAELPLWAPPARLPEPAIDRPGPDPLQALGRVVWIAPAAALENPDTDPVVIGRADTDVANLTRVMLKANAATGIAPLAWNAVVWDDLANVALERAIGDKILASVEPVVALAGFTAQTNPTVPRTRNELSWGRLVNVTGLLQGVTTLGDELSLVWSKRAIARSAFASRLDQLWDGSKFG